MDRSLTSCTRPRARHRWLVIAVASLIASVRPAAAAGPVPPASSDTAAPDPAPAPADPSATDSLMQPEDLARLLRDTTGRRPVVLHVGFEVLFRSGHIAGSRHIGPASTPDGLLRLQEALRGIPHGQPIVLYCGCCPWADCPNVRPALVAARESGSKDVRLLYLPQNLKHDWIDKGLPTSRGEQ